MIFADDNVEQNDEGTQEDEEQEERTSSPTFAGPSAPKKAKPNERDFMTGIEMYEDPHAIFSAQRVAFKRNTRFSLDDHLFNLSVSGKRRLPPLVSNIARGLKIALIKLLDELKKQYTDKNYHQVYVTVIENNILRGLNSGNYDIATPSSIIANRVLSMIYNYLKSFQTLRINPSFKVQLKVLSVKHVEKLRRSPRKKQKLHYFFNRRK